jgi:hypothetical protein
MPTFFNFNKRKGVFMIPAGATKSPTPAPPSFSNTKSLAFDGVDEYVATSSLTGLGMGTTDLISVSLWFKTNATKSFPTAFNTGGWPLTSGVNIYLNSTTNNIGARVNNVAITTSGTNYRDDNWHHILLCYNGSLGSNQIELFVDGVSVGTNTLTGNITGTTTDIHIGANTNTSVGTFRGWEDNIDEVAIFNTDQRANINDIYNGGSPSDLSTYNPIAWYRMGDNSTYQTPQILMPENTNKDKISNWSLQFDGVDDYIGIGTTSLGITSAITVSAWVKIPTTNTGGAAPNIQELICEDAAGGTNRNWALFWRHLSVSDKNFYFIVFHTDGSSTTVQTTGIVPNDGNWHHIMGTFDGTTDANGLKLYVDGTLFQTTAGSTGIRSTSGVAPSIGSLESGAAWRFEGNIDEVAVWNSVQDNSSIYNSGTPTTITGATAYWKLGEQATFSTNWTVPDQVGSNDGTSANMTIEDRVGDASNSLNNAVSFNMEEADIDNDTP